MNSSQDYCFPYIWNPDIQDNLDMDNILSEFSHLHIEGGAGYGKTRCTYELSKCIETRVDNVMVVRFASTPYKYKAKNIFEELAPKFDPAEKLENFTSKTMQDRISAEKNLCSLITKQAYTRPIVIIIEDLHYEDDLRDSLVDKIITTFQDAPTQLLLITTSRFEFANSKTHNLQTINLKSFSKKEASLLIEEGCKTNKNLKMLRTDLLDHAAGHPLYIYEAMKLTSSMSKNNDLDVEGKDLHLLDNLQTLYEGLLNHMNDVQKEIITAASVIGSVFNYEEIRYLLPQHQNYLRNILEDLCLKQVLFHDTIEDNYKFSHDLQREHILNLIEEREKYAFHVTLHNFYRKNKRFDLCAIHLFEAREFEKSIAYFSYSARRFLRRAKPKKSEWFFLKAFEAYERSFKNDNLSCKKLKIDYCHSLMMQGEAYKLKTFTDKLLPFKDSQIDSKLQKHILGVEIPLKWISADYNKDYVLDLLKKLPDEAKYATDKLRLFGMLIDLGYWNEAIQAIKKFQDSFLSKASFIKESSFTPAKVTSYVMLANAYAYLGNYHLMHKALDVCFEQLKNVNISAYKIYCLAFSAKALQISGDYKSALPLIEEAYNLNLDLKIGIVTPDILSIYADNLIQQKDLFSALTILENLMSFISAKGITANKSLHLSLQAQAFYNFQMSELAIEILTRSLEVARLNHNPYQEAYASILVSKILFETDCKHDVYSYNDATTYILKAKRIAERLKAFKLIEDCEVIIHRYVSSII